MAKRLLSMIINSQAVGPMEVADDLMMIDFLHEYLNLTGSRLGCGQGICHACVVIVDNPDGTSEEIRTCITGAHFFDGKRIRTIEGHARRDAQGEVSQLNPIQQQFVNSLPPSDGFAHHRQALHLFGETLIAYVDEWHLADEALG